MADAFESFNGGLTAPLTRFFDVAPNDSTDLTNKPRAILLGTGGDLEIVDEAGTTIVLHDLAGGVWHPIRPVRIRNANTTATNIIGGY